MERGSERERERITVAQNLLPLHFSQSLLPPSQPPSIRTHIQFLHCPPYTDHFFTSLLLPSSSHFLNPSGSSEEREMQTRGKMEERKSEESEKKGEKIKVALNSLHQQNSVAEHEPFWLETWKQ